MIGTIANAHPEIQTEVRLTTPYSAACPHSGEPQEGSAVAVVYRPGALLIELHAVQGYLKTFSLGDTPIDLETVVQRTARDCAAAVGVPVTVEAHYILKGGLTLQCSSTAQP